MSDYLQIEDFLEPLNIALLTHDEGFHDGQTGKSVILFEEAFPDLDKAEIVLVGCNETRGTGEANLSISSPDLIRSELYRLYNWHPDLCLADIGNIKSGSTLGDTYAALKTVVHELLGQKKIVIILGGSHDLTLAQYDAYRAMNRIIEATGIDAYVDLNMESAHRSRNFLMELLTGDPNYIRHYNHIGFQSYFVHPKMLETMDKLRFDCFRLGKVKENIDDMEPVLRNTNLLTIDISSIAHPYAPSNRESLNGFNGEEICTLTQYAGLSANLSSLGIYGYDSGKDIDHLTAKQIAQMVWYFADGRSRSKQEVSFENKNGFNEFHTAFAEIDTTFLQSKKTGRWWMQLPNKNFIACSHTDYVTASNNDIPERWLRAQERD